jgi:Rrf2 family protein
MELPLKVQYAILALLELAINFNSQEPLKANVIASRQDIANRYLEEILALLRQAGIVMSHRGAGGGYLLAKRPEEITIWEVFVCLQGDAIVKDTSLCSAGNLSKKVLLDIWQQSTAAAKNVLQCYTLSYVLERRIELSQVGAMFYI